MSPTEAMVQEILERSVAAGRSKMGDLAYSLAQTCRSMAKNSGGSTICWFQEPSSIIELNREFGHLQSRTGIEVDRSEIPVGNPSRDSAVLASRACLRLAESIEGETARVRFSRARTSHIEGDLQDAGQILVKMLKLPLSRKWFDSAHGALQAVYLDGERYKEAVAVGQAALRRSTTNRITLYNMATAQAWLHNHKQFDVCSQMFRKATVGGDAAWWQNLVRSEANWFAEQLSRSPEDVRTALKCLDEPEGGQ